MTEVVEPVEGELVQKELGNTVSRVRPRPPPPARHSSQQSRSSLGSILKPVTERDESEAEDLSASFKSFDGIDTVALKRLSAMSALDDSERSNRTAGNSLPSDGGGSTSSSSSSGKKRVSNVRNLTEQFEAMKMASLPDGGERQSVSSCDSASNDQFDSFSITSHALSKSSQSTLGMSGEIMESMGDLGDVFEPPANVYQGQGIARCPRGSSGSTRAVPSMSDLGPCASTSSMAMSALPTKSGHTLPSKSGHSMPSLGDILEEDISLNSFASFNTGTSFSTGAPDEVGFIIGGRPISELLKDEEKIAGRTLDVLAPTIKPKKVQMQRWASDGAETGSAESSEDAPPMVAPRRVSDSDSSIHLPPHRFTELRDNNTVPDLPPQVVHRQTSNSLSSSSDGLSQVSELSPPPASRRSVSGRTKRTVLLPQTGLSPRVSDSSFRLSSIALPSGFGELSEHSPVPDVKPRVPHRQDTLSSSITSTAGLSQIPELSPPTRGGINNKGGAPGRQAVPMPTRAESIDTVETASTENGRLVGARVSSSGGENDSPPTMATRRISDELGGPLVDDDIN
ncbi:MAG: hypothetical protein SGBAC_002644 [Bacillariaceae sp.]